MVGVFTRSMDFRPIFLMETTKVSYFFFKELKMMEQTIIPTAKTMATRSDSLGIDHLKPALEYIGRHTNEMKDYQLINRRLNIYGDTLYSKYEGTKYDLNPDQLIKYLQDDLGYEVIAKYKDNRLYSLTLKW